MLTATLTYIYKFKLIAAVQIQKKPFIQLLHLGETFITIVFQSTLLYLL